MSLMSKLKSFSLVILSFYGIVVWYFIHKLYNNEHSHKVDTVLKKQSSLEEDQRLVEVWGKAALGDYLWHHVFSASVTADVVEGWSYGEVTVNKITFRYRTGPGVTPSKVPEDTENLIIILNGREKSKIEYAQMWLNYLPAMNKLENVALVLLGNEKCDNSWLTPYLSTNGGYLLAVFVVYDSIYIDNYTFYQWPLGVATYRNFVTLPLPELRLNAARAFRCNFIGTIYQNSSREVLMKTITRNGLQRECFVKARYKWINQESKESMTDYTKALLSSDLTLNPVGQNTECYRIYEAMSYGSVPVIEDIMTPGECGRRNIDDLAPLRLLKEYNAPVIFIQDWSRLPELLEKERTMSMRDIVKRRKHLVKWYMDFKEKIKEKFINTINQKFFRDKR